MKVIAKTSMGYIVEMDGREIANAAGFRHEINLHESHPGAVDKSNSGYGGAPQYTIKIGASVPVSAMYEFITKLKEKERSVIDGASLLRGMAELMTAALPTPIVGPPSPDFREIDEANPPVSK